MVEDGLGADAEEQQEKKQQLEYEEAMKLLELLQGLSHRTYHCIYQICCLILMVHQNHYQDTALIRCKTGCTGVNTFFSGRSFKLTIVIAVKNNIVTFGVTVEMGSWPNRSIKRNPWPYWVAEPENDLSILNENENESFSVW